MTEPTQNFRTRLEKIDPRDLVYPGVVFLFTIIVATLFFFSTRFITTNINKAFSSNTGNEARTLNIDNYNLVAKKLGITIDQTHSDAAAQTNATPVTTATSSTETAEVATENKNSLTIEILNSTTQKGIAGDLAKALENAGFAKASTGNQKKLIPNTTVFIKESKASFGPAILEEVKKSHATATATTTPEAAAFDVTIVIGTK